MTATQIQTPDQDSLAIAEQYVHQVIHAYLQDCQRADYRIQFGDKAEVPEMETCDCIPMSVEVGESRWGLLTVKVDGWNKRMAIYECVRVRR